MSLVFKKLEQAIRNFPRIFDDQLTLEYKRLDVLSPEGYELTRSQFHLYRLSISLFLIEKAIHKINLEKGTGKHVVTRLIRSKITFPFGTRESVSLVFGIQLDNPSDFLNEAQILSAFDQLNTSLIYVKGSLYQYSQPNHSIRKCILDFIIPEEESGISSHEIWKIKKQFPALIRERVATQTPSIFWMQNEEDNIKNILMLSHELTCTNDIPQVIISFEKCYQNTVTFKAIVLDSVVK